MILFLSVISLFALIERVQGGAVFSYPNFGKGQIAWIAAAKYLFFLYTQYEIFSKELPTRLLTKCFIKLQRRHSKISRLPRSYSTKEELD